jgi:hypothetical protein
LGWDPVADHLDVTVFLPAFLASSASKLPRHECQMDTATSDPREDRIKTFYKKNPSVATNKGRLPSPNTVTNTGSRKHVVLLRSFLFRLPVAAEGRLKVTSPIHHRK